MWWQIGPVGWPLGVSPGDPQSWRRRSVGDILWLGLLAGLLALSLVYIRLCDHA